jgi:hypothetical protein
MLPDAVICALEPERGLGILRGRIHKPSISLSRIGMRWHRLPGIRGLIRKVKFRMRTRILERDRLGRAILGETKIRGLVKARGVEVREIPEAVTMEILSRTMVGVTEILAALERGALNSLCMMIPSPRNQFIKPVAIGVMGILAVLARGVLNSRCKTILSPSNQLIKLMALSVPGGLAVLVRGARNSRCKTIPSPINQLIKLMALGVPGGILARGARSSHCVTRTSPSNE